MYCRIIFMLCSLFAARNAIAAAAAAAADTPPHIIFIVADDLVIPNDRLCHEFCIGLGAHIIKEPCTQNSINARKQA